MIDKIVIEAYSKWLLSEHKRCAVVAGKNGIELWEHIDNSGSVATRDALGALLNVEKVCKILDAMSETYNGKKWFVKMQEKAEIFKNILTEITRRVGCSEKSMNEYVFAGAVTLEEATQKVGL